MIMKWVLVSRVEKKPIIYTSCLKHIRAHLHLVADNFPKYRPAIAGLDYDFDTG